jgi:hypothetical protein
VPASVEYPLAEAFSRWGEMAFRLVHAKYANETERAYVELRDVDDDGEAIATAIFSFRTTSNLTKTPSKSTKPAAKC